MPRRHAFAAAQHRGRRLRIGIDLHGTQGGTSSGVARYARCLLAELAAIPGSWSLQVFCPTRSIAEYRPPEIRSHLTWIPGGRVHAHGVADLVWHWLVLPLIAWQRRLDVVLVAVERRSPFWSPVPVVATVHDLAPMAMAHKYGQATQLFHRRVLPQMLRFRRHLLCVSLHTARDVRTLAGITTPHLKVVHIGVDTARFGQIPPCTGIIERLGLSGRFVLYPARLEHPGKNHIGAIRAVRHYREQSGQSLSLVFVGAPWQNVEAIHAEATASGLGETVIFTGPIADVELVELYHRAAALVFPSHYEGFGLPLVEAMAAGLPIIASHRGGAIPEVVGEAGRLADADDPASFAAAIAAVIDDPAEVLRLRAIGRIRAERFSWQHCAERTVRVLLAACR